MPKLPALDRKVLRDAVRSWRQLAAVGLVLASGVGVYAGMRATMRSLAAARGAYYAEQRFADVFASLVRAPELLTHELADLPGVRAVETRIVADVSIDVPSILETATGRLISLPEDRAPALNAPRVRNGRLPAVGREREVLASEAFVEATGLGPGSRISALLDGKRVLLDVVGTALSPEYNYAVPPGSLLPDDQRFGVFWMRRPALEAAFDLVGAFNDVSLALDRDARVDEVIDRLDAALEPFGGRGAIPRADQQSAFFLTNELRQLQTFALLVPSLFLAVTAFLLHMVVGRLVARQREEIACLKAFGYRDGEVGLHFAKLVGLVVLAGSAAGLAVAAWMGRSLTRLYADLYQFPDLPFRLGRADAIQAIAISALAATLGAWPAVRRVTRLAPAEGLRPAPPPAHTRSPRVRGLARRLGSARALIVIREMRHHPVRSSMTIGSVALATGLTVMNAFQLDSIRHLLNVQFGLLQREDVTLVLQEPRAIAGGRELLELPGVLYVEPARVVAVELESARRAKYASITGIQRSASLFGLLDEAGRELTVPPSGLLLSTKLAEVLGVAAGDAVRVRVLEGARPVLDLAVARVASSYVGLSAYMDLDALCRALGEPRAFNMARLLVDDASLAALHAEVEDVPLVAGVSDRDAMLGSARRMIDENFATFVLVSLSFSLVLAVGVLYNAVRITLSERARELASLRVLGFRNGEVGALLFGELAVVIAVGLPLGLVLGRVLAAVLVSSPGYDTEQFRIPLVIGSGTYALAAVTVLLAAGLSAWGAWRRIARLDLIDVLRARD